MQERASKKKTMKQYTFCINEEIQDKSIRQFRGCYFHCALCAIPLNRSSHQFNFINERTTYAHMFMVHFQAVAIFRQLEMFEFFFVPAHVFSFRTLAHYDTALESHLIRCMGCVNWKWACGTFVRVIQ